MHKHIDIIIVGATGAGKSCVAHAIKKKLRAYGAEVREITGAEDEPPGVMDAEWEDRLWEAAKDMTVRIKTERVILYPPGESKIVADAARKPTSIRI